MKFYKHLYISEDLKKKKEKILRKLKQNKLQLNVQLIALPQSPHDQLEIIESKVLLQPAYPKKDLFVVGLVSSYNDALEFVESIVREVYETEAHTDIRNYILKREQED